MNFAVLVISIGIVVLACGSVALLVVRLTSPNLQGIDWLSAAFAAGAVSASLLLASGMPWLSVLGADATLLFAFMLLHIAVLRLVKQGPVPFWHGGLLLGIQVLVDISHQMGFSAGRLRIISIGLVIAIQAATTAVVLWRFSLRRVRAPALFSIVLLACFAAFNLFRSGAEIFDNRNRLLHRDLEAAAFCLFIAVALGLAFGFFWMTTAVLTRELEHMASTDPLTRLYNRRVFLKWCEKELLRTQRTRVPFSVLLLDLDHFKRVNDSFGHQAGDEVLCAAVEKMQDSVRGIDVLCRWGGEEFAVLLPNAPSEATRIVAERIRENIEKVSVAAGRGEIQRKAFDLTVSIGTATYRDVDDGIAAMLHRADQALYAAKEAGRNRVLVAS